MKTDENKVRNNEKSKGGEGERNKHFFPKCLLLTLDISPRSGLWKDFIRDDVTTINVGIGFDPILQFVTKCSLLSCYVNTI